MVLRGWQPQKKLVPCSSCTRQGPIMIDEIDDEQQHADAEAKLFSALTCFPHQMSAVQSVACRCRIRAAENKIPGKLPFAMRRILAFPGCCHHDGQEQRGDRPGTHAPTINSAFGWARAWMWLGGLRGCVGAWLPGAARLVSTDLTRLSLFASTRPESCSKKIKKLKN